MGEVDSKIKLEWLREEVQIMKGLMAHSKDFDFSE